MRILLVNPPNCGRSIPEERYGIRSIKQIFRGEPLALETLAGNLPEHEVELIDLKVEPNRFLGCLDQFGPDLVAFTAMTCEAQTVVRLAQQVRQWGQAQIVIGGIHASNNPEFFNRKEFDWIILGLGKQSLRELVNGLASNQDVCIPGVAKVTPGQKLRWQPRIYNQRDLVSKSPPRYDLVERYRPAYRLELLGIQMGMVATAVGCPYDCHFCCISPLTAGRYLTADISSVVRDIKTLNRLPVVRLVDANSFGNPQHAYKLAEAIESAGLNKQYLADVRADTVVQHPGLLAKWKNIGLRAVIIGFEEINDVALTAMNKRINTYKNLQAIEILHKLGLTIVGDFIIDPCYDERMFDSLALFVKNQAIELPMYTILTPLPGTRLHQQLAAKITLKDLDYYTLTNAVIPTKLPEELFYQRYAALLQKGHAQAKL